MTYEIHSYFLKEEPKGRRDEEECQDDKEGAGNLLMRYYKIEHDYISKNFREYTESVPAHHRDEFG